MKKTIQYKQNNAKIRQSYIFSFLCVGVKLKIDSDFVSGEWNNTEKRR